MKRLFGGGGGRQQQQPPKPNATPTGPISTPKTATIYGENGAPTADQNFLSELAMILSEEEEAKKKKEQEAKERQQQQAVASLAPNSSQEDSIPATTTVPADSAVEIPPAPTNSTDEAHCVSSMVPSSAAAESLGDSSSQDIAPKSQSPAPLVDDPDENDKNPQSATVLVDNVNADQEEQETVAVEDLSPVSTSKEDIAPDNDTIQDSQDNPPSVPLTTKSAVDGVQEDDDHAAVDTEDEVVPQNATSKEATAPGDMSQDSQGNPPSTSLINESDEVVVQEEQENDVADTNAEDEVALQNSTSKENTAAAAAAASDDTIQDSQDNPPSIPLTPESDEVSVAVQDEEQADVDTMTENQALPQVSTSEEDTSPDDDAIQNSQGTPSSLPLITESAAKVETAGMEGKPKEEPGESSKASTLNKNEGATTQSALHTAAAAETPIAPADGVVSDENGATTNDGGGGGEGGGSETMPERLHDNNDTTTAGDTAKRKADETAEETSSESFGDFEDAKSEGAETSAANKTDEGSSATEEKGEQDLPPDLGGVFNNAQHNHQSDTTGSSEVVPTTAADTAVASTTMIDDETGTIPINESAQKCSNPTENDENTIAETVTIPINENTEGSSYPTEKAETSIMPTIEMVKESSHPENDLNATTSAETVTVLINKSAEASSHPPTYDTGQQPNEPSKASGAAPDAPGASESKSEGDVQGSDLVGVGEPTDRSSSPASPTGEAEPDPTVTSLEGQVKAEESVKDGPATPLPIEPPGGTSVEPEKEKGAGEAAVSDDDLRDSPNGQSFHADETDHPTENSLTDPKPGAETSPLDPAEKINGPATDTPYDDNLSDEKTSMVMEGPNKEDIVSAAGESPHSNKDCSSGQFTGGEDDEPDSNQKHAITAPQAGDAQDASVVDKATEDTPSTPLNASGEETENSSKQPTKIAALQEDAQDSSAVDKASEDAPSTPLNDAGELDENNCNRQHGIITPKEGKGQDDSAVGTAMLGDDTVAKLENQSQVGDTTANQQAAITTSPGGDLDASATSQNPTEVLSREKSQGRSDETDSSPESGAMASHGGIGSLDVDKSTEDNPSIVVDDSVEASEGAPADADGEKMDDRISDLQDEGIIQQGGASVGDQPAEDTPSSLHMDSGEASGNTPASKEGKGLAPPTHGRSGWVEQDTEATEPGIDGVFQLSNDSRSEPVVESDQRLGESDSLKDTEIPHSGEDKLMGSTDAAAIKSTVPPNMQRVETSPETKSDKQEHHADEALLQFNQQALPETSTASNDKAEVEEAPTVPNPQHDSDATDDDQMGPKGSTSAEPDGPEAGVIADSDAEQAQSANTDEVNNGAEGENPEEREEESKQPVLESKSVDASKQHARSNPRDGTGSFSFSGFRVPGSLRQGVAHETIFDDFEDIKSSFRRLLVATSSTATTFSEVAAPAMSSTAASAREVSAPALAEAGNIAASSATAATGIIVNCRREIEKRRSERNLLVSFVQGEPVPSGLALSSESDLDQYRNDVSHFLGNTSNHDNGQPITGQQQKKLEEAQDTTFRDPVLKAAVAGAQVRKRRIEQQKPRTQSFAFTENHELASSLKRLTQLTASTAATVASAARPAFQEVAAVVGPSMGASPRSEEEVFIVSQSAAGNVKVRNGQRVLSAVAVSFERSPADQHESQDASPRPLKHATFRQNGVGEQALGVLAAAGHSLAQASLPLSGIASSTFKDGSRTPVSTMTNPYIDVRQQRWRQESAEALKNPKHFMDFLANKLRDHAASDRLVERRGGAPDDTTNSVFAHERKPSRASSISSPGSPGVLSLASDSDDDSHQTSVSTSSSPMKPLHMSHPAALLWDMVDESNADIDPQQSDEGSLPTEIPYSSQDKPLSAVSVDISSPQTKHAENEASDEEAAGEGDQSTLLAMETHVEDPEESERSELSIEPMMTPQKEGFEVSDSDVALPPTTASAPIMTPEKGGFEVADSEVVLQTPISSERKGGGFIENNNVSEEGGLAAFTPPRPNQHDGTNLASPGSTSTSTISRNNMAPSNRKTQSVAQKRQRQSDKRLDQFLAVRSVKSADIDFDENDSMSLSGYISLPSSQFHDNGSVHKGSRHTRNRLSSPQSSVNEAASSLVGNASFSGSRRGSLYSAKKSSSRRRLSVNRRASSRRLLREESVTLFPSLRAIESGQTVQFSGLRHSMSENNLLLPRENESEASISFQPGLAPDLDDISGVEDGGGGMLDLALMALSAVGHSNILNEIRNPTRSEPVKYLAAVRWRQLVSNWKHLTLAKALTERPCSPHYQRDNGDQDLSDDDEITVSTGVVKSKAGLDLLSFHQLHGVIHRETKNLNGLVPHLADGELTTLTNFIVEFGSTFNQVKLANVLPDTTASVAVDALVALAASNLEKFAALMEDIVHFAAHNHGTTSDCREPEISYSVGIKSHEAIEKKSQCKYSGDLLQVKDILRAQVTFGDEGSLVAGMLHLCKCCASKKGDGDGELQVELVRVKNLFQKSSSGSLCVSSLPTGYRHILVTVRLGGLLLAEIQFQLAEMFEVLGFEGYYLHREIVELDEACQHSLSRGRPVGLPEEKDSAKSDDSGATENIKSTPEISSKESTRPGQNEGVGDSKSTTEAKTKDGAKSRSSDNAEDPPEDPPKGGKTEQKTSVTEDSSDTSKTKEEAHVESTNNCATGDGEIDTKDDSKETKPDAATEMSSSSDASVGASPDKQTATGESTASDDGSIRMFEGENRLEHLTALRKSAKDLDDDQVLSAIRAHAIKTLSSSPRDVSTFHCLHIISMLEVGGAQPEFEMLVPYTTRLGAKPQHDTKEGDSGKEDGKKDKTNMLVSKECLLRCLAVSNQGTSVGMTGWLEYGAENSFGRIANAPLLTLRDLAYTFACQGDWGRTVDTLRTLTMKCDQHLPVYHPTALTSMLDLAGAARMASSPAMEQRALRGVATRLAFYLSEQEQSFFSRLDLSFKEDTEQRVAVLQFENGMESIPMLQAFVEEFESQLSRDLLQLVGSDSNGKPNEIVFISHCFLADALSVLANCILAAENFFGVSSVAKNTSRFTWRQAFTHYEIAFKGHMQKKKRLSDEAVVTVAYGMARCLRELGCRGKALQILSSVVSALGQQEKTPSSSEVGGGINKEEGNLEDERHANGVSVSFLPYRCAVSRRLYLTKTAAFRGRKEHSMALFLWLMAVFSVEDQPNERGRMRALSLLHAASETLQSVVNEAAENNPPESDSGNGALSYRQTCRELLLRVEQEAKDLLEPLEAAVAEAAPRKEQCGQGRKGLSWAADPNHPSVLI